MKKKKKFSFQKRKKKCLKKVLKSKKKQTIYSYALACFIKFNLKFDSANFSL